MSVVHGGRARGARGVLGSCFLFVCFPAKKNFYLFCAGQIGDLSADSRWEPECPPSLTETTHHCPETKTSQLETNLLPGFKQ